jgi:hypothetical protein
MFLRNLGVSVLLLGVMTSIAGASVRSELDLAAKQGQVAFILVTEPGTAGTAEARAVVQQTMLRVKRSTLIELERSNPENAALVAQFRLAGAPVPLIILVARNGVIAGGLLASQATPEALVGLVPSPKKAEILKALQSGKPVFISATRKGMPSEAKAAAACAAACSRMGDKSVLVRIDMADTREAAFLAELKVNTSSAKPVTLVINAQGQVTGSYTETQDVASLVQAATRTVGGCAPGACGPGAASSCAPAKK